MSLAEARKRHAVEKERLDANLDPAVERKNEKARIRRDALNPFETIAREWHKKQLHVWTPRYSNDVLNRLEKNLFGPLGTKPIKALEPPDLLDALRTIEERGSYDQAHRVLQLASQIFSYAVASGYCTRNIALDLQGALPPRKPKSQPAVKPEEFPALLKAIDSYQESGEKKTSLAMHLLALTFVRTTELIGATWDEFDLEKSTWCVPAERIKMKAEHLVPLSRQSKKILNELKPLTMGGRFILPGRNGRKPMSNNTMLFALYRLGYKGKMTGHGFRSVASTILNESNEFRSEVIERQLDHCERNKVRGAYNRAEYMEERIRMMQWWADYIDNQKAALDQSGTENI